MPEKFSESVNIWKKQTMVWCICFFDSQCKTAMNNTERGLTIKLSRVLLGYYTNS